MGGILTRMHVPNMLGTLASRWNKQKFRCYEAKIEESEKASSHRESNPGHLDNFCAKQLIRSGDS